jgi:hypothetical protein
MKRAVLCATIVALGFAGAATAAPTLTSIGVFASDGGGWLTYPTASGCGIFHLFVAENGDPVNGALEETIDDSLAPGTYTLGLIGTDGNGAGTTQRADLTIDGSTLEVQNHSSATANFDGDTVTASLAWSNKSDGGLPYVDRVAVCGVYPDGYQDSYGTLTLVVAPPDTTPPTITATPSVPPNANGWNNTPVSVSFSCVDNPGGSGVDTAASNLATQALTASGTVTGTCVDNAGNSATASYTAQIDETPPTISFAGNAGTYTVDQTVSITCSADGGPSGISALACPAPNGVTAGSLGVGTHTYTASATDGAGNTSSATVTFTVSPPTPAALGNLTVEYVQGSANYAALNPRQQAVVTALTNAATQAVARIVPRLNTRQKAAFEQIYAAALGAIVQGGWLTAGQAATLENLAADL